MKALTVRQPWASLIAAGIKTIETRPMRTRYRGPIAIHAGMARPPFTADEDGPYGEIDRFQFDRYSISDDAGLLEDMPLGAVIATAELVDCLPIVNYPHAAARAITVQPQPAYISTETNGWVHPPPLLAIWNDAKEWQEDASDQLPYGDFTPGRFGWMLANAKRIKPVPAKGQLGLWNWEPPT